MAKIKYHDTCEFFKVKELLPVSLGQVLAAIVIGGMTSVGRALYATAIQEKYK